MDCLASTGEDAKILMYIAIGVVSIGMLLVWRIRRKGVWGASLIVLAMVLGFGVSGMQTASAAGDDCEDSANSSTTGSDGSSNSGSNTGGGSDSGSGSGSGSTADLSSLSRIPWEGGSSYWTTTNGAQFAKADAAGWDESTFFPIVSFSNAFVNTSELEWDRSHGINVYQGLNIWSPYRELENYDDMFYIGDSYTNVFSGETMPDDFAPWVGRAVLDEVDGIYESGTEGLAATDTMTNGYRAYNDGRFVQANYSQRSLETYFQPYGEQYINHSGVDSVSMDMYWYTMRNDTFGLRTYVSDVNGPTNYRRASSYGAMVDGMRQLDATDNELKPKWMVVEMLSGSPSEEFVRYIDPAELKGAAINSIIHEARGIVWFNHVASTGYGIGNVLRAAQAEGTAFAGYSQVEAMGEVNAQIKSLAPVINTQSYAGGGR